MAGVQRTPPTTPRTQFSSVSTQQTRSESDIFAAVSESDYVNINRSNKRPHNDVSPHEASDQESPLKLECQLAKWKKEQDSSIAKQLADQTDLIAKLSSDIGEIKKQNNLIQASNAEICKTNAGIVQSLEFFNKQFEDLKREVETLRKERRDQQIYIENLEHKIIDLQRKSRSSGIELRNIPQEATESSTNLIKTVCNIGSVVGVRIAETDLRDIYRLPGKANTSTAPRPIVAEFSTVQTKQSLISAVRLYNKGRGKDDKLNTSVMGIAGDRRPVYIAEHLPPSTKKLFYLAREFASKNAYKFCWISNGNIYLRKFEGDKQILVSSEKSLCRSENQNQM